MAIPPARGLRLEDRWAMYSSVERFSERSSAVFVKAHLWRARKREDGQTMAEYAVVLGVITAGVIVAITALSGGISGAISSITGLI
jgi:Flp pilus assembly pilin Flp